MTISCITYRWFRCSSANRSSTMSFTLLSLWLTRSWQ